MLNSGLVLLQGNAHPHTAHRTQDLKASYGWEQLHHPPYSFYLTPNDYYLFLHLKEHYKWCKDDDDVKTAMIKYLEQQAVDFNEDGYELVVRYDNCLNIGGNYVEKYIKFQAFL